MFILITAGLLFATALTLVILRLVRPQFRFAWLAAVGATFLAWLTVFFWRPLLPISLSFGTWEPAGLLSSGPLLLADQFSWVYALSLVALALAALLTATVREGFPDSTEIPATLAICGFGLLAVTAGNPLTLALLWAALDVAEIVTMLGAVRGPADSRRVVTAFAVHGAAVFVLVLAQVMGGPANKPVDFPSMAPGSGLLLLLAVALRLSVLPLRLPSMLGSANQRGIVTSITLVSAAAALVLLSRVPVEAAPSFLTALILIASTAAALYASWMWLRAPDELAGRAFWIMGLGGLALFSALRGNPQGAAAWGVALILAGAALFLSSAQHVRLSRVLFVGAWGTSALPLSVSATAWNGRGGVLDLALPVLVVAQAFLLTGFVRHALRSALRTSLQSQPAWGRSMYPAGIGLLLLLLLALGFVGWDGALQLGSLVPAVAAAVLTAVLLWAVPRLRFLNPLPAHWLQPTSGSWFDRTLNGLLGLYRWFARLSQTVSDVLEGDAGLMWTLLFLVLFIVMIVQRSP